MQKRRLEGSPGGRRALALLGRPEKLLQAILLGNTLVNVSAASIASLLVLEHLRGGAAFAVSVLGMTFLLLVAGEISPKIYAALHPERVSAAVSLPLSLVVAVSTPLSALLSRIGSLAVRLAGGGTQKRRMSETEIMSLLELGHSEGVLGTEALATVALLSLGEKQCRQAMMPRLSVTAVRTGWTRGRVLEEVRATGFRKLPVLEEPGDTVAGWVDAVELLSMEPGQPQPVYSMPFFPENAPLDSVLDELRACGSGIGAVFDEYGDWAGIITVEDIMEFAVFQSIGGRKDLPDGVYRRAGGFVIPASMRIETLERLMDTDIDPLYAETAGGLLEEVTGRIPASGESLDYRDIRITVISADGPRLGTLAVERMDPTG